MWLPLLFACHRDLPPETGTVPTEASPFAPSAVWGGETNDWEPFTAADQGSPWVYQVTTRLAGADAVIALRASDDGGATWGEDRVVGDSRFEFDPIVAVASATGCVFVAWLHPIEPWETFVQSSCDHGATFTDPVRVTDWSSDHGWLLVSPDGADLYVAFNGTAPGNPEDAWQAAVVASHDGGATWGEPWVTGDGGARYWFQTGGAIAADGTVYYAAAQYTHDYRGEATVGVWRSTDRGATFEIRAIETVEEPPDCAWAADCEYGFLAPQAAIAVDAAGGLLVVAQASDAPGGHQSMQAWRSPGGAAWDQWSEPAILGSSASDNGFPSAAAGLAPGDFRVAWQANSPGDPGDWNTWYQSTTDGGATWLAAPVRLSDASAPASYRDDAGYRFPYGDYLAIAVDGDGGDHVVWGEGESYDGPGGTWSTRRAEP